jgi:hypothetical protein
VTLQAHGSTVRLLARIVRAGLAVAKPEVVKAGGWTLSMLRLTITDVGREALASIAALSGGPRMRRVPWW